MQYHNDYPEGIAKIFTIETIFLCVLGLLVGIGVDYRILIGSAQITKKRAALISTILGIGACVASMIPFVVTIPKNQFSYASIKDPRTMWTQSAVLPFMALLAVAVIAVIKLFIIKHVSSQKINTRDTIGLFTSTFMQSVILPIYVWIGT